VFSLPRQTKTTTVFDGYRIPEDSRILLPIRAAQRDARFYDDPDEFRPSRWDGDLRSELHNFAYCPFGGGPRICIGREFALLEAKLALATIGREYDLAWRGDNEPDCEPPVSPMMTTRMEEGQEFEVRER
jgi:cytochrome P450